MDLHHNGDSGMLLQRFPQHAPKGGRIRQTAADRKIASRLIHHQHEAPLRRRRFRGAVVFADPLFAPQAAQRPGAGALSGTERRGDPPLKGTGAGGVVVDAQVVDHQRQWRRIRPKPERADEAVFATPEGQLPLGGKAGGEPRRGLEAPSEQRIEGFPPTGVPAAEQPGGSQQRRQRGDGRHAPRWNAEAKRRGGGDTGKAAAQPGERPVWRRPPRGRTCRRPVRRSPPQPDDAAARR